MSWSSHRRAIAGLALIAALATGLGACSFSPVYSGVLAANPTLDIAFAKPASRLEQIIYQELSFRLGVSTAPTAPLAKISVTVSGPAVGLMTSTPGANTATQVTVSATLTLTQRSGDAPPVTITRRATADYTTNSQVLANTTAATEATERAARAAAESLRLALLATLSRG